MPTLRENLKDHPIQSILTGLASLATIIGFIFILRTESCNKKIEQDKSQTELKSTTHKDIITLQNPVIKNDSSTIKEDSIIKKEKIATQEKKILPKANNWILEKSYTQNIREHETFFLQGEVRISVMIFSDYSYVNVFFPGEAGKSYKREELQLGEEKLFESTNFPYKFNITYLSSNVSSNQGSYQIKVLRKH